MFHYKINEDSALICDMKFNTKYGYRKAMYEQIYIYTNMKF